MTNPRYMRPGRDFAIGKLVEELGELQAALGKMLCWGPDSYNPELPPEQRETNSDWVEREIEDVIGAISNYRAALLPAATTVRAAAMSDLIAGDADMYDTPSARITGDKDRENPVEGAQRKPAVTQADVEIAEEIGQHMASYYEWGRPSDYQLAKESAALARELIAAQVEREIVAWLRAENGTCDCYARSEGECACGAWDDYKSVALVEIIDAIEQGQYRSEG